MKLDPGAYDRRRFGKGPDHGDLAITLPLVSYDAYCPCCGLSILGLTTVVSRRGADADAVWGVNEEIPDGADPGDVLGWMPRPCDCWVPVQVARWRVRMYENPLDPYAPGDRDAVGAFTWSTPWGVPFPVPGPGVLRT